ncbi:uncharacterized protein LOC107481528 [Arachis duranensis]|uniref:Uncharacterized protein LOC107481528 n=1 Tax=Arachis duranensis TaxID=130453 RepID=A0A9C6TDE2_ARADU|nr:uncharacterized protein LOC107481528 [Arachis duranensis]
MAFVELKDLLSSAPVLQSPEADKPLYLYLFVSNYSISSVLITETGKTQKPVYFVSKVMQPTERRYPKIEQLALTLVTTAKRLRHYFQSHTIIVRTNQPLRQILTKPELAGRLTKWSIELSEFDIQFQSRPALKSQILANFAFELTPDEHQHSQTWELHVDGASNREGSRARIVLKEGDIVMTEQSLQFHFSASNNQAKYEALIAGLKLVFSLQGEFQVKDPLLEQYWLIAKDLISKLDKFVILHVHGEKNIRADILSKLVATRASTQTSALSQLTLEKPSIESLCIMSITHTDDWRIPYIEYINTGIIPRYETNPQNFKRKASLFTTVTGELYRREFSHPLLKCLGRNEANEVMNEIHEGVCGNHIGGRALAAKIIRIGYYWPTIKRDCITKVKTCDNCQKRAAISMKPAEVMHINPGETPFKLVYGSQSLIPIEVDIPTLRTELYNQQQNANIRNAELDLAEEDRDIAAIKQKAIKQIIERRHNKKVVPRTLDVGDLVLRRTEEAKQPPSHGKLAANWEGPFRKLIHLYT